MLGSKRPQMRTTWTLRVIRTTKIRSRAGPRPEALPVTEKTYLVNELYVGTIIRNPKKGSSFRLKP